MARWVRQPGYGSGGWEFEFLRACDRDPLLCKGSLYWSSDAVVCGPRISGWLLGALRTPTSCAAAESWSIGDTPSFRADNLALAPRAACHGYALSSVQPRSWPSTIGVRDSNRRYVLRFQGVRGELPIARDVLVGVRPVDTVARQIKVAVMDSIARHRLRSRRVRV